MKDHKIKPNDTRTVEMSNPSEKWKINSKKISLSKDEKSALSWVVSLTATIMFGHLKNISERPKILQNTNPLIELISLEET